MFFDIHWHARDWTQAAKETVAHSLQVAEAAGIDAIAAMPNTDPLLTDKKTCLDYLALDTGESKSKLFVHIGLTEKLDQVKRAVEAYREVPDIIGMKLFCCKSTGDLSVVHREAQYDILATLAKEGYDGVLMNHFGAQELMQDDLFDVENPETWSTLCRPSYVEAISFDRVLRMAEDVGFLGVLHATHVSSPHVVHRIAEYNGVVGLSCDITPHHLLLNNSSLAGEDGVEYKCNPPIRPSWEQQALLQAFKEGKIPSYGSDHAPHLLEDKHPRDPEKKPASGVATGQFAPYVHTHLNEDHRVSRKQLHQQMFQNAKDEFSTEHNPNVRDLEPTLQPDYERLEVLMEDYHFNAFQEITL